MKRSKTMMVPKACFETLCRYSNPWCNVDDIQAVTVPRSVHKNNREISSAIAELESTLNRADPSDAEVAKHMGSVCWCIRSALTDINVLRLSDRKI
ncbi:hypothetical protein OH492_21035 [Vibrio chagasii]|nr:hypothetical protein [Vibrio chagasii]